MVKSKITIIVLLLMLVCSSVYGMNQQNIDMERVLNNWEETLLHKNITTHNKILNEKISEFLKIKEESFTQDILPYLDLTKASQKEASIFTNLSDFKTNTASMAEMFNRIEAMLFLYKHPKSKFYNDAGLYSKIIGSLNWLYDNVYNDKIKTYGNWWHWEIGVPKKLVNILVLLKNTPNQQEELIKYIPILEHFIPNPKLRFFGGNCNKCWETGANLLDKTYISIAIAVLKHDSQAIKRFFPYITETLQYITKIDTNKNPTEKNPEREGVYKDGSFIQHYFVPYNGGYGASFLARIVDLINLFQNTDVLSQVQDFNNIYDILDDSFLPYMHNNELMHLAQGRGFSRSNLEPNKLGQTFLYYLFIISSTSKNQAYKDNYSAFLYNAMKKIPQNELLKKDFDFDKFVVLLQLKNNAETNHLKNTFTHKKYNIFMPITGRMLDHRANYSAGVTTFSKDISSAEYGNGEGKDSYYTGIGMLQIYNEDNNYNDGYWPTVSMFSLPGTTVDNKKLELLAWTGYFNSRDWVGGVSNGEKGFISMDYSMNKVTKSSLEAKKSWFFLNNKIISLATNITSDENSDTVSIIENRKIAIPEKTKLIIDGQPFGSTDATEKFDKIKWALIQAEKQANNLGYLFLDNNNVNVRRAMEQGSWHDLNDTEKTDVISREYIKMTIDHGTKPKNQHYAYMIMPSISLAEIQNISQNNPIDVLSNNANAQAIYDKQTNTFMASFYQPETIDNIVAKTQGAILIDKEKDNLIMVNISDPTNSQKKLEFIIPKEQGFHVINKNNAIEIQEEKNAWHIMISPSLDKIDTYQILFKK